MRLARGHEYKKELLESLRKSEGGRKSTTNQASIHNTECAGELSNNGIIA